MNSGALERSFSRLLSNGLGTTLIVALASTTWITSAAGQVDEGDRLLRDLRRAESRGLAALGLAETDALVVPDLLDLLNETGETRLADLIQWILAKKVSNGTASLEALTVGFDVLVDPGDRVRLGFALLLGLPGRLDLVAPAFVACTRGVTGYTHYNQVMKPFLAHAGAAAVPYLVAELDHPDPWIRDQAVDAIGLLRGQGLEALKALDAKRETLNPFSLGFALWRIGSNSKRFITPELAEAKARLRSEARVLVEAAQHETVSPEDLRPFFDDPGRMRALSRVLSEQPAPRLIEPWVAALPDLELLPARRAILTLFSLGDDARALELLGRISIPEGVLRPLSYCDDTALVQALEHPSLRLRLGALEELQRSSRVEPRALNQVALWDPDPLVRQVATRRLSSRTDEHSAIRRLAQSDPTTWLEATRALQSGRETALMWLLDAAIESPDRRIRGFLSPTLPEPESEVLVSLLAERFLTKNTFWQELELTKELGPTARPLTAALFDHVQGVRARLRKSELRLEDPEAIRDGALVRILEVLRVVQPRAALIAPALPSLLEHDDAKVRKVTATLTGELQIRDRVLIEALKARTRDRDEEVRRAASDAFTALTFPAEVEKIAAIVRVLLREPPHVGWPFVENAPTASWEEPAPSIRDQLRGYGEAAVQQLVQVVRSNVDADDREQAAWAVGWLQSASPPAIAAAADLLDSDAPDLVAAGAWMAGRMGERGAPLVERLIETLSKERVPSQFGGPHEIRWYTMPQHTDEDDPPFASQVASWALRRIGPPAVEPLVGVLRDGKSKMKILALLALERIAPRSVEADAAVARLLNDSQSNVRAAAAQAYAAVAVDPLLGGRLLHGIVMSRRACLHEGVCSGKSRGSFLDAPDWDDPRQNLCLVCSESAESLHALAVRDSRVTPLLIDLLAFEPQWFPRFGKCVINVCAPRYYSTPSGLLRQLAEEARPALEEALGHENKRVREWAKTLLHR